MMMARFAAGSEVKEYAHWMEFLFKLHTVTDADLKHSGSSTIVLARITILQALHMSKPTLPKTLSKADYEILADFRYQIRRYLRFSEEASQQYGITGLQYLLLLQLKGFPGREWATVAELAERLQAHHHGTVNLITRCEKVGLVERRKGDGDQRFVQVSLLPKGEQLLKELALLHRDQLADLGTALSIPDVSAFSRDI
ncbi:MarR family winged helix-turn-helix transcriptional regulator [Noviherbaspirillum malthae]|jgi:DNA-binding MarR family transcriptional regulator|uniref:MarR family winged helix-turn-helix transcriptional regulator n=1 Tax=Noviherbaspirillum malthae TaxID=1260987 RepID=UPI002B27460C|nr:MarR family transcriptional regulator [Noviherbaspirillum malthae]